MPPRKRLEEKDLVIQDIMNMDNPDPLNNANELCIERFCHPFEITGQTEGKPLTLTQKTISYFIYHSGGSAREEDIVAFLNMHQRLISKDKKHQTTTKPDMRVLHLNMAIKKKGEFLFLPDVNIPGNIIINGTYDKPPDQIQMPERRKTHSNKANTFDQVLYDQLKKYRDGLMLEEIVLLMKPHEYVQGLFMTLPIRRRVRAQLIVLKNDNRVNFNDQTKAWSVTVRENKENKPADEKQKNKNRMPNAPKIPEENKIKSLSISELYDICMKGK